MIRVVLPYHLRTLARLHEEEVQVEVNGAVTIASVIDAIEVRHPELRGTIRDHYSGQRRPFIRYFACKEDWSHESANAELPDEIATGHEPLMIIGAMAGG